MPKSALVAVEPEREDHRRPPSWLLPSGYPSVKIRPAALAWFCLRRQSTYRRAWERLVDLTSDSTGRSAEAFSASEARCFGIADRLVDPGQDAAPLFLQSCTRIAYAELATSDGGSDGEVSITFDAKRATKAQLQSVERWYTQWAAQWRSEHRDQIPKRTRKLPSTRSAILAIRAFDGRAAGASVPQIALALFADGRDRRAGRLTPRDVEAACKKARRAIKLADWLTQEGYLELALKETYRPADELATPTKSSV